MKEKINIVLSFLICIIILISIGVYADKNNEKYKISGRYVDHTRQIISYGQMMLSDVQDAESAGRAYVITGREKFLLRLKNAAENSEAGYLQLKQLIQENNQQKSILEAAHQNIKLKISFSEELIQARKTQGYQYAQSLITEKDDDLMNEIRNLIERFINNENVLLNTRLVAAKKDFSVTNTIIVTGRIITFLMLIAAFLIFIRHYNKKISLQKTLAESELRIHKILESLPVGVFVMNAKGLPYYANEKSKNILGKGIIKYDNPDQLSEIYAAYEAGTDQLYPIEKMPVVRALNGEKNVTADDMEIIRDGIRIPLRINAAAITNSYDKIEYAIAVFEDITKSKEVEDALIAAKIKAEESVILVEAFLANMSHEIRTPMNAIIGFTELLSKRKLGETEKDYVHTIKTAGENLLVIINNVLDLSKIESGTISVVKKPLNIKDLLLSLRLLFINKAKKLHLVFECDNKIPEVVLGDAAHLTQVLINLINNAIKFTEKGEVRVVSKLIQNEKDKCLISFAVSDTGIGISADQMKFIFDRFRQAESHTSRKYGGTGLGLNIAKELAELQGGNLQVKSKQGEGSVFTFELPFDISSDCITGNGKKVTELDPARFTNTEILIVEDNPINIKLIKVLLSDYPIHADIALNGNEAVKKVKEKTYDLILMDIEMPEMNGYDATLTIRHELKSDVPIIAMTAHAMAGEKEKCLQLGMNDFISKPIDAELLIEKIFQNVQRKIFLSETGP